MQIYVEYFVYNSNTERPNGTRLVAYTLKSNLPQLVGGKLTDGVIALAEPVLIQVPPLFGVETPIISNLREVRDYVADMQWHVRPEDRAEYDAIRAMSEERRQKLMSSINFNYDDE